MKRVLLTLAWTVGAYFASSIVLGALFGIFFFVSFRLQYDPSVHRTLFVGVSRIVPAVVTVCFLILAICRRLPGTR
jgi:hypothetical protein